jgi:hypothetical protein
MREKFEIRTSKLELSRDDAVVDVEFNAEARRKQED